MPQGSVDVIVSVGDAEERIQSFRLAGAEENTVTIAFRLDAAANVSVSFSATAFLGFVRRLLAFSHDLPGRPS